MIRVVAPPRPLQQMLLLELQGKVAIPPKLLEEAHEQQHHDACGVKRSRDTMEPCTDVSVSEAAVGQEVALEVPLGHMVGDSRNETRCSLRIGTLVVDGSRGNYGEPLLVLKRRDKQEQLPRVQEAQMCSSLPPPPSSSSSSSQCCLLQEWLEEHPEELTLNAVCAAAEANLMPTKVYELVGVAGRYVHLKSKPLRTLS